MLNIFSRLKGSIELLFGMAEPPKPFGREEFFDLISLTVFQAFFTPVAKLLRDPFHACV